MKSNITVALSLQHLKPAIIYEILRKTGWYDMVDYRINVVASTYYNEYNTFYVTLTKATELGINNKNIDYILNNSPTFYNDEMFYTVRLNIDTIELDYRNVLTDIMGISQERFEMFYPYHNSIYITVPYKKWFMNNLEEIENLKNTDTTENENSVNIRVNTDVNNDNTSDMDIADGNSEIDPDEYINMDEFETDSDNPKTNEESYPPLYDFNFNINEDTRTSYILFRVEGDDSKDPKIWKLFENYRPLYYSRFYKGYIVGLSMFDKLNEYGATFVDIGIALDNYSDDDSERVVDNNPDVQPLIGYEFKLNKHTNNSYILYNTDGSDNNKRLDIFGNMHFSKKHNGYIVSLRLFHKMVEYGAEFINNFESHIYEEVD